MFSAAALLIYLALSWAFFGTTADWRKFYLGSGQDPVSFVWFLHWWPFAIAHGLNPFITHYVWAPAGYDLAWATSVPAAALVTLPITLAGGAVLSFNILSFLAPALAAWTAFLLVRNLTEDPMAALPAGYVFGFSSYELGQLIGHLNLDLIFLVPVAVLLCVRRFRGGTGRPAFIVSLGLVLLCQIGFSLEIFATTCVMGALAWAACLLFAPAPDRPALLRLACEIAAAAFAACILAAPILYYVLAGQSDFQSRVFSPVIYAADLLNYVIPTDVTRFGRTVFPATAGRFTANISEQGAYLGLPLILIMAACFWRRIGTRYVRALLLMTCVFMLCSLGPDLWIGGHNTKIPLPWAMAVRLPLIHSALPTRLTMFVSLCAAVTLGLFLAGPGRGRLWRYAAAGIACFFLLPNKPLYVWPAWPAQTFFTPAHIAQALGPMPNVLILPYASNGPGMAWQLNAGMQFTQSGGYVGLPPKHEQSWAILSELQSGMPGPGFGTDMPIYCKTHGVDFLLLGPNTPPPLDNAIQQLGWPARMDHGVQVIKVPDLSALKYHYITGDYWPSPAAYNFMGKRIQVVTHGEAVTLSLSGKYRPLTRPVLIRVENQAGTQTVSIGQGQYATITLPANAVTRLTASQTFDPDSILKNGDSRDLSVLVSVAAAP